MQRGGEKNMSEYIKNRVSFISPEGKVEEAKRLLTETFGDELRLSPNNPKAETFAVGRDGSVRSVQKGRRISGVFATEPTEGQRGKFVDLLSSAQIAGYSRETKVFFFGKNIPLR